MEIYFIVNSVNLEENYEYDEGFWLLIKLFIDYYSL